ncbi:MAG: hypothetical protein SP1CHLAM54_16290 [Chlamydiia bacterium]|nr:hypothetical protein [Chlamydiia bacterium]
MSVFAPVFVKSPVPVIAPERVALPVATLTLLVPTTATASLISIVSASASVPPVTKVTVPVPSALLCDAVSVPSVIVVPPEYWLFPSKTRVPAPVLSKAPEVDAATPSIVKVSPKSSTSIVSSPLFAINQVFVGVIVLLVKSVVPSAKVTLPDPIAPASDIDKVPALTLRLPLNVPLLSLVKTKIAPPVFVMAADPEIDPEIVSPPEIMFTPKSSVKEIGQETILVAPPFASN